MQKMEDKQKMLSDVDCVLAINSLKLSFGHENCGSLLLTGPIVTLNVKLVRPVRGIAHRTVRGTAGRMKLVALSRFHWALSMLKLRI